MKPVAILYATREGQTKRIAEKVAAGLRERGLDAAALDVRGVGSGFDPGKYSAVVLAASARTRRPRSMRASSRTSAG